jgi:hypothetical protein
VSDIDGMAAELARKAIMAMRGGPVLALSPERSEAILAAAFAQVIKASQEAVSEVRAQEREACAKIADDAALAPTLGDARMICAAIRARGAS